MAIFEDASGSKCGPHIESSESDQSSSDSDIQSDSDSQGSEPEEDNEDLIKINVPQPSCFVSPDGTKFWTPNCEDQYKPYPNMHFPELEDAYSFYWKYGRICGFDVRKSTKKSDSRGNFKAKYFLCNRGGNPNSNHSKSSDGPVVEASQSHRRTTSRRCNCKAKIVLKPAGSRGFVVMKFIEEHNHPLASGDSRMFLKCNRKVSIGQQYFIMDCARANIGSVRAHSLQKEMVGLYEDVGATISDFKNFSRDVKQRIGDHDTDMILAKFKLKKETSNNSFYYDYKVDKQGHLTGLFWTDAIGQANFEVFGDIVSFDLTFRTNRYNMVFVPFTGVDNHWKNVTFAAGLLAKENYKNFKWLIKTFNTAMGRAPPSVIIDQCPAIKKALSKHWKSTKHRLCMWHIMNKLPGKVGHALATNKKFMDKLKYVVYSDQLTPNEFEEGWKAVISEYKLESNDWLTEMFKIRNQWIPAYFSDFEMAGLLRTTSRSESSNSFFQHFHESGDTLIEFYSSYESAMDRQRIRNKEDDNRSEQIPLTEESTMKIEKDASQLYTLGLYYLVREEIRSGCCNVCMEDMTKVSLSLSDNHVVCSCKHYFRRGYLCRHAFAALHHCGMYKIPRQFVKPRWTKNAVKRHSTLGSSLVPPDCEKSDRKKLKRTRAWFAFNNCMNSAGEDEELIDMVITDLDSLSAEIMKKSHPEGVQGNVHRVDKFIDPIPQPEIEIQNPHISRNKGCGKRIKSSREISIQSGKPRTCSNCGKAEGHNARSCPKNK